MLKYRMRDTVLLSGWLFADLLLGLAVIFMVSLPGAQKPVPPIIKWSVSPATLSPSSSACKGGPSNAQCTVTLSETSDSQAPLTWHASSDMDTNVGFDAGKKTLSPGESIQVTLSRFPCQNGSFAFTHSDTVPPLVVQWNCKLPREQLQSEPRTVLITVHDINGLLQNTPSAINDVEKQIRSQSFLTPGSVGISIVYAGSPTPGDIEASKTLTGKIYDVLRMLSQQTDSAFRRTSYYNNPLHNLNRPSNEVQIDVYLFQS